MKRKMYPVIRASFLLGVLALVICAGLTGCRSQRDLIDREILFGRPDKVSPQLSPDGNWLTYLAPYNDVLNIWISESGVGEAQPLTNETEMEIHQYFWDYTSSHIVYFLYQSDRDQVWIYSLDVDSRERNRIVPRDTTLDRPLRVKYEGGCFSEHGKMFFSMNYRDPQSSDIYEYDLASGELTLIYESDPLQLQALIDNSDRLRGYLIAEDDGGQSLYLRSGNRGSFRRIITWNLLDDASWPICFSRDNQQLYLRDSRDRNNLAITRFDPVSGSNSLLFEYPGIDVEHVIFNPVSLNVDACIVYDEKGIIVPLNDTMQEEITYLENANEGDLRIISRTRDDSKWLVAYMRDNGPVPYYTFTRETRELEYLFSYREDLENVQLAEMQPVEYTASDGETIKGYLTLPVDWEEPGPLVLHVNYSAYYRFGWGYSAEAQWLANRGYACLQVNPRGTWGRGKSYMNAGNREWSGLILQDLKEAVEWAVEQGIADPERVGIYGASYGGYAALSGVTTYPDVFKVAVAVSPFVDLESYLSTIPPYLNRYITNLDQRVGKYPRYTSGPRAGQPKDSVDWNAEDWQDIEFLRAASPFRHTANVQAPVLITHGVHNWQITTELMDEYVDLLRKQNVEVDYMLFQDEGGSISNQENRLKFFARAERFLADHLGGDYED